MPLHCGGQHDRGLSEIKLCAGFLLYAPQGGVSRDGLIERLACCLDFAEGQSDASHSALGARDGEWLGRQS